MIIAKRATAFSRVETLQISSAHSFDFSIENGQNNVPWVERRVARFRSHQYVAETLL